MTARRLDLSPVWFAHRGAATSLPWLADLDMAAVRDHCVGLADAVLTELGLEPQGSAIISLDLSAKEADRLADAGVVASARAGRIRLAFHVYNTIADVELVLRSLGR
jgi:selenocysteine lyase/cysteine desulfurase